MLTRHGFSEKEFVLHWLRTLLRFEWYRLKYEDLHHLKVRMARIQVNWKVTAEDMLGHFHLVIFVFLFLVF
jgi:hypothetical protein